MHTNTAHTNTIESKNNGRGGKKNPLGLKCIVIAIRIHVLSIVALYRCCHLVYLVFIRLDYTFHSGTAHISMSRGPSFNSQFLVTFRTFLVVNVNGLNVKWTQSISLVECLIFFFISFSSFRRRRLIINSI